MASAVEPESLVDSLVESLDEASDVPEESLVAVWSGAESLESTGAGSDVVVTDCSAQLVDCPVEMGAGSVVVVGSSAVVGGLVVSAGAVVVLGGLVVSGGSVVVAGGFVVVVVGGGVVVPPEVGVPVDGPGPVVVPDVVGLVVVVPEAVPDVVGLVVVVPDVVGRVVVGVEVGVVGVLPDPSTELVEPEVPRGGIGTSPSSTVRTVRPPWSSTRWGTTSYGMLSAAEGVKPR